MTTPHEDNVLLNPGDKAPAFSLQAHPTGTVSLSDFHGKKNVILAFYPKDNTPGCTKEMCTFTERHNDFDSLNTVILGISTDDTTSHAKFAADHGLVSTLLADPTRETGVAYGAIRGDRVNADRILFLIDKNGLIREIHNGMPDFDDLHAKVKALEELQA